MINILRRKEKGYVKLVDEKPIFKVFQKDIEIIVHEDVRGYPNSAEARQKMSVSSMRCRADDYCDAWADSEYKQDCKKGYCERCGVKLILPKISKPGYSSNLLLHHVDLNPKNCHPDNLQTLCVSCHMKLHQALRRK